MAKRPSGIAPNRVGVRGLSWEVDYCEELRNHLDDFVETRLRLLIALGVVGTIGIALAIAGRGAMASYFGVVPGVILLLFAAGNEWMLRRTSRKLATDCPDAPVRSAS